jgi:transcription antitermination protein NusB
MRIRVMQALYAWHSGAAEVDECFELNLKEAVDELRERENVKGDNGDSAMIEALYFHSVKEKDNLDQMIEKKANNWELERIALIDRILMQMCLVEIMNFPEIPPKVSINEYIDIAKKFSTPKSSKFINGILDGILMDLRLSGQLNKSGKGLVDETAPERKKIKRDINDGPMPALRGGKPFNKGGKPFNKGGGYKKEGGGYKKPFVPYTPPADYNQPKQEFTEYEKPAENPYYQSTPNYPANETPSISSNQSIYNMENPPAPEERSAPKKEGRPRINKPFPRKEKPLDSENPNSTEE